MEETDAENFDKFIERHWGNKIKQTVLANSVAVEETSTKKTRKPRKAKEV